MSSASFSFRFRIPIIQSVIQYDRVSGGSRRGHRMSGASDERGSTRPWAALLLLLINPFTKAIIPSLRFLAIFPLFFRWLGPLLYWIAGRPRLSN